MKVGLVPNACNGYSAVLLDDGDYGEIDFDCHLKHGLEPGLQAQVVGELRHCLLSFCWRLRAWYGQWATILAWAAVSAVVLGTQKLWSYGAKTAVMYGWIYWLFFGDGLMALSQLLCHAGALRRAKAIRKGLSKATEVRYSVFFDRPPAREAGESEAEFTTARAAGDEWWAPYYAEMSAKRPRSLAGFLPNRLTLLLQILFVGPLVPRPRFAMEIGTPRGGQEC
jgi:hypothetical protein